MNGTGNPLGASGTSTAEGPVIRLATIDAFPTPSSRCIGAAPTAPSSQPICPMPKASPISAGDMSSRRTR